jgi:hypothetical protein
MLLNTWETIRTQIEKELDIQAEIFIDDDEIMGYGNQAIDEAEAEIMNMYQGYFKSYYSVPMVSGASEIAMPTDIYANKILYVQYEEGEIKYKVIKIKDHQKVEVNTDDDYMFDVYTVTAGEGPKFVLYPAARVTTSSYMKMWYIRNANRIISTSSVIDIPEFSSFIINFVKVKCAAKELHPILPQYMADLEKSRQLMKETLDNMIPDDQETIDPDLSFYEDFDSCED